jgi:RTX calcium-binding nonapeptide repeat (4 copies)
MIRRTHMIALAVAALMAAFASQASAATVNLSDDGILTYAAAPGEANTAVVTRVPGAFRVADLGAPVNAGVNCQQSGGAVTCPSAGVRRIQAFTFDRDDQIRLLMTVAPPTIADGGTGNDLVEGSQTADILFGGNGRDTLIGHGGADQVFGGADADLISGDQGADRIDGGSGQDRFFGGSGNDDITSRDTTNESVQCGLGADRVHRNVGDSAAADCETVTLF